MWDGSRFSIWHGAVCLFALLLPFGEGGAVPGALFLLHTLILSGVALRILCGGWAPGRALLPPELGAAVPCFLATLLLCSWNTPAPYASFLRCWDIGMAVVALLLVRGIGWAPRPRRILEDCVLASSVVQALVVLSAPMSGGIPAAIARRGLLNSNHEAAYLNLGILLTAPSLLDRETRGKRWRGVGVLLCLAALTQLASRGALMGLGAGALLLAALAWRGMPQREGRIAGVVLLLAVAVSLWGITHRFTVEGDPYPFQRAGIWAADLRIFAEHPLLGVGPGIFHLVAHRFSFALDGPVRYAMIFSTPHSDFLGLLAETGLAGFAAGIFLLSRVLTLLVRCAREPGAPGMGLLSASAALAVQGGVEDLTLRPALLLSVAILTASVSPLAEEAATSRRSHAGRVGMTFFAAAPLLVAWIVGVLNPLLAVESDRAMRHAPSLAEMEAHLKEALRANPYQAGTYRFPASAFLSAEPPVELTLDLYSRFRRELDEGIRRDSTSADLFLTRARLEGRALRSLLRDDATAGRALASYREGIRRVPHDPRPRLELAGFLRDLGKGREALEEVEKALREEPGFLSARLLKACLLVEAGDRKGAREEWERAGSLRRSLASYRPESSYARDITRDFEPFEQFLKQSLEGS
jgi:O-antigen ligase